jgi:FkbM family methyltransferase
MKENIKKIWKFIMRFALKIYASNFNLYVSNYQINNKEKHYSQFGQDLFVQEFNLGRYGDKFFVDIGGNHPVNANNTYLLELNGWRGITIEPQDQFNKLWPSFRKTNCINCVIGPEEKEIIFYKSDINTSGLSGVEGFNKCNNRNCEKIPKQQIRLDTVLTKNMIHRIDYLSIDVEGYEMNVLRSIDFLKADITLIGIENDLGFSWLPFIGKRLGKELGNNKIRKFLKNKGYRYIARIMSDDFFVKN